jgi:hypothetical protein
MCHQSSSRSTALERASNVVFLLQKGNSEIAMLFGTASKIEDSMIALMCTFCM